VHEHLIVGGDVSPECWEKALEVQFDEAVCSSGLVVKKQTEQTHAKKKTPRENKYHHHHPQNTPNKKAMNRNCRSD